MDTTDWIPMRWPCGPLEIERRRREESFTADEHDTLEQWLAPRMLTRIEGTPVNCLVVPWADGVPSDEEQPRALGPLVSAAREHGVAVVGEVGPEANPRRAAGAAEAAGLLGLATESEDGLEGFPVLRFGEPGLTDRTTGGFLGVRGLPFPGLKIDSDGYDAVSGPTGPPWIDSNAWFVRLAREVLRPATIWVDCEPREPGGQDPSGAYVQAVADAEVYGARWLVTLDPAVRLDVARGNGPGLETWSRVVQALEFFAGRRAWAGLKPVGLLGVVSDFSGANEALSFEVLNLLSRYSRLYRIIRRAPEPHGDAFDGLEAVLYVDAESPAEGLRRRLYAFAEAGGILITGPGWERRGEALPAASFSRFHLSTYGRGRLAVAREELVDPYHLAEDAQALMSHRHDLVRVFNPGVGRFAYSRSEDGRSGLVHLFPCSRYSFETHVSIWLREPWAEAVAWQVGGAGPETTERTIVETGVEFLLPPELEVNRPRSTNADLPVRPGAPYRAIELSR